MSSQYIEKYEILDTLGKGSMGVVYKARDPEIGRMVAIKTLKSVFLSEDAVGQEALQRFRQESRSAGRLHHPNIVTIFEAGRAQNGSPYIVMEYIEGQSLEALLRETGPLEPLQAFHYLAQIASAIDYALSQNIIHRDIKPSNIIIDQLHRPFLLDFGVAKLSDTSLTPAGTVVGTPSYMSPEQIRGENLDGRSDLFSYAVVTYEVLTGKRPFPGTDFATVVSNILQKQPLPFSEVGCSLPKYLESVLGQGLAREREQRFPTATEFIDSAAQTLGISVDNTGLIGGFRPGMKLSELASWQPGGRVRAPTLLQGVVPGGESGGAASGSLGQSSQSNFQGNSSSPSQTSSSSGAAGTSNSLPPSSASAPQMSTRPPQPSGLEGSGDDGETRLITAGQKLFQAAAQQQEGQRTASSLLTQNRNRVDSFGRGRGDGGEGEDHQDIDAPSKLPIFLAGFSFLLIVGTGAWYYFTQMRNQGEVADSGDSESIAPGENSGEKTPLGNPTPVARPSSAPNINSGPTAAPSLSLNPEGSKTPVSMATASVSLAPEDLSDEPPPDPGFLPSKPSMPVGGFTASQLHTLKDEEIAWLLSEQQQDSKMLRLLIAEVGNRSSSELILRLMPISMHQDYAVRIDVIKSLSRSEFRSNSEVMAIIIAALSDSEFLVRGFAAKTLAAIGSPEAVKALQNREADETNTVVKKVIQDSLASIRKAPAGTSG